MFGSNGGGGSLFSMRKKRGSKTNYKNRAPIGLPGRALKARSETYKAVTIGKWIKKQNKKNSNRKSTGAIKANIRE